MNVDDVDINVEDPHNGQEPADCFKHLRVKIAVKRYRVHETLVLQYPSTRGGVAIQVSEGSQYQGHINYCRSNLLGHASRGGGPYVSCSINFFITNASTDSGRNSTLILESETSETDYG